MIPLLTGGDNASVVFICISLMFEVVWHFISYIYQMLLLLRSFDHVSDWISWCLCCQTSWVLDISCILIIWWIVKAGLILLVGRLLLRWGLSVWLWLLWNLCRLGYSLVNELSAWASLVLGLQIGGTAPSWKLILWLILGSQHICQASLCHWATAPANLLKWWQRYLRKDSEGYHEPSQQQEQMIPVYESVYNHKSWEIIFLTSQVFFFEIGSNVALVGLEQHLCLIFVSSDVYWTMLSMPDFIISLASS